MASTDSTPASQATYTLALRVRQDGPIAGRTVHDAGLRSLHGVFLAGVERSGQLVTARPETMLGPGDVCYFAGDVDDVVDLLETPGLESAEQAHVEGTGDRPDAGLYEVVVSERSELAGSTLRDVGFRARYDAAVLAIKRHDDDLPGKLGTVLLRPGDVLLVLATPEFERVWRGHSDFSVIASRDTSLPPRRERAWMVLAAIFGMIALGGHEHARSDGGVAARRGSARGVPGDQRQRSPSGSEPERGAHDRVVGEPRHGGCGQRAGRRGGVSAQLGG